MGDRQAGRRKVAVLIEAGKENVAGPDDRIVVGFVESHACENAGGSVRPSHSGGQLAGGDGRRRSVKVGGIHLAGVLVITVVQTDLPLRTKIINKPQSAVAGNKARIFVGPTELEANREIMVTA